MAQEFHIDPNRMVSEKEQIREQKQLQLELEGIRNPQNRVEHFLNLEIEPENLRNIMNSRIEATNNLLNAIKKYPDEACNHVWSHVTQYVQAAQNIYATIEKWYQGVLDTFKNEPKIADQYREKILSALQEKSENQPAINIEPLKDFLWAGIYLEGCVLNLAKQGDKENNTHKIETAKKLFSILSNANKYFTIYEKEGDYRRDHLAQAAGIDGDRAILHEYHLENLNKILEKHDISKISDSSCERSAKNEMSDMQKIARKRADLK